MRDYQELIGLIVRIEGEDKKDKATYVEMGITDGMQIPLDQPRKFSQLMVEVSRGDVMMLQKNSPTKVKKEKGSWHQL